MSTKIEERWYLLKERKWRELPENIGWELTQIGRPEKSSGGNDLAETGKLKVRLARQSKAKECSKQKEQHIWRHEGERSVLVFRNQMTPFMEGDGVHSVCEFGGTMLISGWQSRKEASWEWEPVHPECLAGASSCRVLYATRSWIAFWENEDQRV